MDQEYMSRVLKEVLLGLIVLMLLLPSAFAGISYPWYEQPLPWFNTQVVTPLNTTWLYLSSLGVAQLNTSQVCLSDGSNCPGSAVGYIANITNGTSPIAITDAEVLTLGSSDNIYWRTTGNTATPVFNGTLVGGADTNETPRVDALYANITAFLEDTNETTRVDALYTNISQFLNDTEPLWQGNSTLVAYENENVTFDIVTGNTLNITSFLVDGLTWSYAYDGSNLVHTYDSIGGVNYVGWETSGGFMHLYANPGPANDNVLWTVSETQGADTEVIIFEGGTNRNRLYVDGSVRFGGANSSVCNDLTSAVDCDTSTTGADLVVQDDIYAGGAFISGTNNWSNVSITEAQITDLTHTTDTNETTRVDALYTNITEFLNNTQLSNLEVQNIVNDTANITVRCDQINFSGTIGSVSICDGDDNAGAGSYDLNVTANVGETVITDSDILSIIGVGNITTVMNGDSVEISFNGSGLTDTNETTRVDALYANITEFLHNETPRVNDLYANISAFLKDTNETTRTDDLYANISAFLLDTNTQISKSWSEEGINIYNDTTDIEVGIGTSAPTAKLHIVNTNTTASIFIDANGAASSSTSTGGALRLDNTGNTGAGLIIYSNVGATADGRLLNIRADNVGFDQAAFHIDYDGVANAAEIVCNTNDTSSQCLNILSTNVNDTVFSVTGRTVDRALNKYVHIYPGVDDSSSSALAIDLQGTGTSAQGIFMDAPDGGTKGNFLKIRNNGAEVFNVEWDGSVELDNGTLNVTRDSFVTNQSIGPLSRGIYETSNSTPCKLTYVNGALAWSVCP